MSYLKMRNYVNFLASMAFLVLSICLTSACNEKIDKSVFTKEFKPEELKSDVDFLIKSLEDKHIGLYERANKDSIYFMRTKIIEQINQPMTRVEFFKILGRINPYFNDAHCLVFPLIDEADLQKENGNTLFPFHVVIDEFGMLSPERSYKRDSDNEIVDKSWRIKSINEIEASTLINQIANYSHGESKLLQKHMTTLLFADWLFTLYGWAGEFSILFDNGKTIKISPSDKWNSLENNVVQYNRLEILENNTGYLRLGSFDVDEHKAEYENFVDESFSKLNELRVDKLIIDVRDNTGGQSDAGALVLKHITSKTISQVSKAFDRIKGESNKSSKNVQPSIKEIDLSDDDQINMVETNKQFKGEVIVLFNEMTYSAGIIFITIVQDHKLAKTIGRPTGGFANQTGNMEEFRLPNSKLLVYVPTRKFVRPNGNSTAHYVIPDIIINKKDTLNDKDAILSQALLEFNNKK